MKLTVNNAIFQERIPIFTEKLIRYVAVKELFYILQLYRVRCIIRLHLHATGKVIVPALVSYTEYIPWIYFFDFFETVATCSCIIDSVDSVRALLSAGVNPCVPNDSGHTPFQLVVTEELKNAFVQELLQAIAHSKFVVFCSRTLIVFTCSTLLANVSTFCFQTSICKHIAITRTGTFQSISEYCILRDFHRPSL